MRIARRTLLYGGLFSALVLGLIMFVVACGDSSSTSTTTTASAPTTTTAAASTTTSSASVTSSSAPESPEEAAIKANWEEFFDGSLPVADGIALLENGQQYAKELEAQAASPLGKAVTASVSSVTVTSPSTAEVTYSILLSGQVALPDQTGQAVLQDGVWKVSAESFLALLALQQGATTPST